MRSPRVPISNLLERLLTSQPRLVGVALARFTTSTVVTASLAKVPKATGRRVLLGREHCDARAQMRPENMRPLIYTSSAVVPGTAGGYDGEQVGTTDL